jgi:hypothetical protein
MTLFVLLRGHLALHADRLASRARDIGNRSRMAITAEAGCY